MLNYVRTHWPAIIIMENVDCPELTSAITALIASLGHYHMTSRVAHACEHGDMSRSRRYFTCTLV